MQKMQCSTLAIFIVTPNIFFFASSRFKKNRKKYQLWEEKNIVQHFFLFPCFPFSLFFFLHFFPSFFSLFPLFLFFFTFHPPIFYDFFLSFCWLEREKQLKIASDVTRMQDSVSQLTIQSFFYRWCGSGFRLSGSDYWKINGFESIPL